MAVSSWSVRPAKQKPSRTRLATNGNRLAAVNVCQHTKRRKCSFPAHRASTCSGSSCVCSPSSTKA
jgi:hypothetical protein